MGSLAFPRYSRARNFPAALRPHSSRAVGGNRQEHGGPTLVSEGAVCTTPLAVPADSSLRLRAIRGLSAGSRPRNGPSARKVRVRIPKDHPRDTPTASQREGRSFRDVSDQFVFAVRNVMAHDAHGIITKSPTTKMQQLRTTRRAYSDN